MDVSDLEKKKVKSLEHEIYVICIVIVNNNNSKCKKNNILVVIRNGVGMCGTCFSSN